MRKRNLLLVLPAAMMVASPALAAATAGKPAAATQVGPVGDEIAQDKRSKSKTWLLGALAAAGLGLGLALSSSGHSQAPVPASP